MSELDAALAALDRQSGRVLDLTAKLAAAEAELERHQEALERIIDTHYTEHISCADLARQALQEQSGD